MVIRIVAEMTDPDDWPIRYVQLTSEVTRRELADWASGQQHDAELRVVAEAGGLSAPEIAEVLEPQVRAVEVQIRDSDA